MIQKGDLRVPFLLPLNITMEEEDKKEETDEPVLCNHCGRTASNGLVCIGMCVADSGY